MIKRHIILLILLISLISCAPQAETENPETHSENALQESGQSEVMSELPDVAESAEEQTVSQSSEAQSSVVDVTIENFAFNPTVITIKQGTAIRWTNKDGVMHTATGDSFDTGPIQEGESKEIVFNEKGEFKYICTPHPNMRGKVIVE